MKLEKKNGYVPQKTLLNSHPKLSKFPNQNFGFYCIEYCQIDLG